MTVKENFVATHPVFQESCGCKASEKAQPVCSRQEKMTLIFGGKNGIAYDNTNLIKKELFSVMGEKTESDMYLFSPIHFREREVGYLVLSDCDYMLENQFLFEALNTFTESLEYLYGKIVHFRLAERQNVFKIIFP